MTGILYERKCVGCGTICNPYANGPLELKLNEIGENREVTRHVVTYGCNNCDLLQFFEIDSSHVSYFEDLARERKQQDIRNPTWKCKDCDHEYDVHDMAMCLGVNIGDKGERIQNCKCYKFAFNKTIIKK